LNVLGIETSCDETSAAVVANGVDVRSNIVASQADLHARYGGVVPEVASRAHVEQMLPVVAEAVSTAGLAYRDLDAMAVTNRPGLLGALLVGVSSAKAMAYALDLPLLGIHHLEGHVYSAFIAAPDLVDKFPILVLVVSGGHTQIVRMEGHGVYRILGRTRDDAAGEAFDKGARLLGLPYPGGPNLARLAEAGDPDRIPFPRALLGDSLDFSFSGVKTSLRTFLLRDKGSIAPADVAASYQAALVSVLTEKLRRAVRMTGISTAGVVGGVAANTALSASLRDLASAEGIRLVVPSPALCTDNAAMIASAGYFRFQAGSTGSLDFDTFATEALGGGEEA
jgi:N6-L-threonylcarbamoyladenine synthase